MKVSQNILNAQAEESFRKRWDLPDNWKDIEKYVIRWEKTKSYYGYKPTNIIFIEEETPEDDNQSFGGGNYFKDDSFSQSP